MLDPPDKVVRTIVRAIDQPRPEINVGYKSKGSVVSERIARSPTHSMVAELIDHAQMENAPPAPNTAGSLYEPMREGQGVEGGVRDRMAAEDEQRRLAEADH